MNRILATLLVGAAALHAAAYDFMADGLAYNVNPDGNTVSLTFSAFGNNYPGTTTINVPERVTGLGRSYTVTAVGSYALYECEALTALTLPATVTTIDEYAAFGSQRLAMVRIGSNVTTIGNYAFAETGLTEVTIPVSVQSVGDYAFAKCPNLIFADLGNGVVTVGRFAFSHCKTMTTATLGANVTDIKGSAFAGCTMLKTLNCAMPEPPAIDASVFNGVDTYSCLLRVPRASQELYASAPVWSSFKFDAGTVGYTLTASDIVHRRGTLGDRLSIALNNEQQVSAVQLDLVLPAGVSIALQYGDPDVLVSDERRSRDHNVRLTVTGATAHILLSSPTGKALKGTSGELLSVGLAYNEPDVSTSSIILRDASVATPAGDLAFVPETTAMLILQYLRGDADGDGSVDVADYTVVANHLVNHPTHTCFLDAADTNRNGFLDVADLQGITLRALLKLEPEVVTQY